MDRQAAFDLMNVTQKSRVGIRVGCRLTINQDPVFRDASSVDSIFDLERHTPVVFIIITEEEIGIIMFIFVVRSVEQLLGGFFMSRLSILDIRGCSLDVTTKSRNVSFLETITAGRLQVPGLRAFRVFFLGFFLLVV